MFKGKDIKVAVNPISTINAKMEIRLFFVIFQLFSRLSRGFLPSRTSMGIVKNNLNER
jgi:hypothetical protein